MSAMRKLVESICAMYDNGYSPKMIARLLDMSKDEVEVALNKYHPNCGTESHTTH
jgi:hypothetical protein